MGNPSHKPTDERKRMVKAMTGYGMKQDDVAAILEIDDKTLRKHYALELRTGAPTANAKVMESLFINASRNMNVTAQIWWEKTRMGMRETVRLDGAGEGGAIVFQVLTGVPRGDNETD